MKLKRATRYGLYAAAEMARATDGLVTVAQVAQRYAIPEGALAKSLQQLVRSRLAIGTRGIGGGYRLARAPRRITVQEVIEAFEDPRPRGGCLLQDRAGAPCSGPPACRLQSLFDEVDELVTNTFASVTLDTLVRRQG